MAAYSLTVENILKKYIDGSGKGNNKLRQSLQYISPDSRYQLLKDIRGHCNLTGLHAAAVSDDLESIKYMLRGFTTDRKYEVVKIQNNYDSTALHHAAFKGHAYILIYLLNDFSQQQRYNLLRIQDREGSTALHDAASQQKLEVVQAILTPVSSQQQVSLLRITNNVGDMVTSIRPELRDELPVLIRQGKKTFLVA